MKTIRIMVMILTCIMFLGMNTQVFAEKTDDNLHEYKNNKQQRQQIKERHFVELIPNIYWGESINNIQKDYAVEYVRVHRDKNVLVYELNLENPYDRDNNVYNNFIKEYQQVAKKVELYLWHNRLYKIDIEYKDDTRRMIYDKKLFDREMINNKFERNDRRSVYHDVKRNNFYVYWGQPYEELNAIYELKWGVWGTDISYYVLQLRKIYRENSPYLVLWFNKNKLYKIYMYFPKGEKQNRRKGRVINDLVQKFGSPIIYDENILMWEDTSIKVNTSEEQKLEKKFYYNAFYSREHIKWKQDNE